MQIENEKKYLIELKRILELKNIIKYYQKNNIANNLISLKIYPGDIVGVIGESGCGKSTLAKVITGIEEPNSGEIFWEGKKITNKIRKEFKKDIQIIFQNPISALNPKMNVEDIVLEPLLLKFKTKTKEELIEKVKEILKFVNLDEKYYKRKANQLSGGQCQRVAIARALVTNPKILICDEITSALDVYNQYKVIEILKKYSLERKITILFITHNIQLAKKLCNRIVVMKNGEILEEKDTKSIFEMPEHSYTKMLINL